MALTQRSLPLNHFYRETYGSQYLSQNAASNEILTPFQLQRVTVGPTRYERYQALLGKKPLLPWGRNREYGGIQKVQLPVEFVKPRGYPPEVVEKGHRHFGDGSNDARDLPVPQFYDVTQLHRSDVRINDQVLPPPADEEMNKRQIDLPFPAEHPYYSHVSRMAVFPNFKTPDDPITGDPARGTKPLGTGNPASPYNVILYSKTKGAPFRRELQENPTEAEKEPLLWTGENDFYNLKKSPKGGQQTYFPTPPKMVHPNLRLRPEDQRIELRTTNSLRNVEREQWKTTYDYNYTGSGPSNVMHLDDYHKKMVDEIKTGEEHRNTALVPTNTPSSVPPRPVEGRYARLYQNRRPISADIRYPDRVPGPDTPDVSDSREYMSYPAVQPRMRRKDEWYITSDSKDGDDCSKLILNSDKDVNEQWKIKQLESHPEHGLHHVEEKKDGEINTDRGFEILPKTVEECIDLPEQKRYYLKAYQEERNDKFKKIEAKHGEKQLKLKYLAKTDMQALRHKIDQVGTRLEPLVLDQHSVQVAKDDSKFEELQRPPMRPSEKYITGLKFTTEKISDNGPVTALHDRQLDGYKNFPKTWRKDIPTVDPPRQNHAGSISDYTTKGNAFSLSTNEKDDTNKLLNSSISSTGSILRVPGSPPRTGASKSISFNEIVRVASSEYGSEFKIDISPLSKENGTAKFSRPSTPQPQLRSVREPSVYPGISPIVPALRPNSAFPHCDTRPPSQDHWLWNYDVRMKAQFDPLKWQPTPSTAPPQTSLLELQNDWNKADVYKRFHESFPENSPDMRDNIRHYELADNSADLRFHHSIKHREKRHKFYGFNSYHFHNANPIV